MRNYLTLSLLILLIIGASACDQLAPQNKPPENLEVEETETLEKPSTTTSEDASSDEAAIDSEAKTKVPSLASLPIVGNASKEEQEKIRDWTIYFLSDYDQEPLDYSAIDQWVMKNEGDKKFVSIVKDADHREMVKALFDSEGTLLLLYTNDHFIYKSM